MGEKELRELPPVATAFQEGRDQAVRYRDALGRRYGEALQLRSYVVVAVGLERLLGEETTSPRRETPAA